MNKAIQDTPQVLVFHTGGVSSSSQRTWDNQSDTWDQATYTWDDTLAGEGTTEVIVSNAIPTQTNAKAIPS